MARICLVTHVVTPWDGQGRVNYELARYLIRRGHDVTLAASRVELGLLRETGIRWLRVPVPDRAPDLVRWGVFAMVAWLRLPRAGKFDIVHLNGAIAPVAADVNTSHFVHASWQPVAATRHYGLVRQLYYRLTTAVCVSSERRAYTSARRVVAVSDVVAGALRRDVGVPAGHLRVIYNGVDHHEFRPRRPGDPHVLREPSGLPTDAFVLLFVGDARSSRKNLDLALAALARTGPEVHLVVVGDAAGGPYRELARGLGVSARTHFLGPRRDVADCYRDADAVFCASRYEPASLVLLEAMASGLPVICCAGVGNAAFLTDRGNGFLLPSDHDAEGAAQVIAALQSDLGLRRRIGMAARDTASLMCWERMGQRYEELYRELLAGPGRVTPQPSPAHRQEVA